ncbi:hypothetical protein SAMD00079811_41790 [Scytonema sp. HK-05]|uniref:hypothetical protein n=1 Tax=Scytonema sp. HK-05 TaxID=1137095 RepID=UPI000935A883|nr:hypothetical protein [Scytonema sp. HK-05]OKH50417.1 hypothetical protein NIES2130_34155 [Scytonema sp. HK-05]BAY46567.1 hypothetical protein SAMD00079811_41790 [Scytonema sp. HK-05]
MKLNKNQLDLLGTVLGVVAGVSTVLTTQGVINAKVGGSVSGIATVLLGVVVQRPTDAEPTTQQAEQEEANKQKFNA